MVRPDSTKPATLHDGPLAGTARGFGAEEFRQIGRWILAVVDARARSPEYGARTADAIRDEVAALARRFPIYEGM